MSVALVGAGPGDARLLSGHAVRLLHEADVVVYDRLASAQFLRFARDDALLVYVGKSPERVEMTQDEINALLVEHGRAGKQVVRLKGGDPFVFGRGGEEAEALMAAGVEFEVVPGVTSAIAAPAYAGIPVTHRGVSTHFTVVTGHEDPSKGTSDVYWDALAKVGGTLVILMGVGRIAEIAGQLTAGGLSPDTPVAAVRNGTRPEQVTTRATLGTIAEADLAAPSVIVVGDVAALDLGWFEHRPLHGKTIVVTRAREQVSQLGNKLAALGAVILELPTIEYEHFDFTIPDLAAYDWLVLTSPVAPSIFYRQLTKQGLDARALGTTRVAVIGDSTGYSTKHHGIVPDLVPERFVAESLLEAFPDPDRAGARVLIARAEQARDVLPDGLRERGYEVDVLPIYRTVPAAPDADALARVRAGDVDGITFASSSTVTNFCDLVGDLPDPHPPVFSIGPITSQTARERGLEVTAEADPHTILGVAEAVIAHFS